MNRILVPLNPLSDYENILNYAESIAQRSDAKLTVLFAAGRGAVREGQAVYRHDQPIEPFVDAIRKNKGRNHVEAICHRLLASKAKFTIKIANSFGTTAIVREANQAEEEYDLILMGTHPEPGLKGMLRGALAMRVIGAVRTPVFVVPRRGRFNEIQHITYAVDLSDYDPNIIQQVKSIATLFDAKLTIAHVNAEVSDQAQKEQYLSSLERTITDTLDYPKIYYRFFDHTDPLAGLKKLINLNESNIVAMTNRKKLSARPFSSDQSLTRKMARELTVPILAFRKHR